jgi:hypothetical protein
MASIDTNADAQRTGTERKDGFLIGTLALGRRLDRMAGERCFRFFFYFTFRPRYGRGLYESE